LAPLLNSSLIINAINRYIYAVKHKEMVSLKEVQQLFNTIRNKKILIIGDVMVDAYLWGKVDRISPEAPVPVVACDKRENRLGGAANVALNILSLGATPVLCAVIGDDEKGRTYRELMEYRKLTMDGIITDPSRPTTSKTRILSNHQQLLRVDQEITNFISEEMQSVLLEQFDHLIQTHSFDAIIFQDYDKGCITPALIKHVVEKAGKQNIPTLVDPKKRNFMEYRQVTLFKPNFKELTEGLKKDIRKDDQPAIKQMVKQFLEQQQIQSVLLTLSELGVYISNGHDDFYVPAEIRDIADVSGAGDTVISMASLCLAAGWDAESTAWLSNLAGGLVCEKVGVVPVKPEWILKDLSLG